MEIPLSQCKTEFRIYRVNFWQWVRALWLAALNGSHPVVLHSPVVIRITDSPSEGSALGD